MCHGKQGWIKALAIFGALLCIPGSCAEQVDPLMDVSYEVKFLLDADAVLTEQHLPTEALEETLALEACRRIDVIYLETADRAFNNEGWINRLRWKSWKKKPERAYKKRYPVEGMDQSAILEALERLRADGLDVASESGTLEIDWGYSSMTLSASWEVTEKYRDLQSLSQFNTGDAIACAASTMPTQEVNWKRDGWGLEAIDHAQKIGPLQLFRAKGSWEGIELTLDIIFPKQGSAPIAELSFEAGDYQTASEKRNRLTGLLEDLGILLKEDSLKTQTIIDANLLAAPEAPDLILPADAQLIEEYAFEGCACRYAWIGDAITEIRKNAFADCPKLRYVRLPGNAIRLENDVFSGDEDLVIIGLPGSDADNYARDRGHGFIPEGK